MNACCGSTNGYWYHSVAEMYATYMVFALVALTMPNLGTYISTKVVGRILGMLLVLVRRGRRLFQLK